MRIDSADMTEIQPAEYRADLVVLLLDGVPVLGIIVEAQLSPDERKRFVWRYVAQGRLEGRATLVTRMLERRFGPLQADALERIASASIEDLDAIGERLLTAETLAEALA